MKWLIAAVLTFTVGLGGAKSAFDYIQGYVYLQKTDAYAAAKAKYAPTAPRVSSSVAHSICSGFFASDAVGFFDPSMGVTQEELDAFSVSSQEKGRTCDESVYLGSVRNDNGSTDEIYRLSYDSVERWYIFTVTDGLISDIQ